MDIKGLDTKLEEIFKRFKTIGELSIYKGNTVILNKKTTNKVYYPTYKYNDAFLHILLMMGLNKNKIDFNEKINYLLKDLKDGDKISFLNLLKDETGLIDLHGTLANEYQDKGYYAKLSDIKKTEYDTNFRNQIFSLNEVIDQYNKRVLEHLPGGGNNDFNRVMQTLGIHLVEILFKDSYDNILENIFFKPLGIKKTKIGNSFKKHRLAYYNMKQSITVDNKNDLFIGLTINDCYLLYEALNNGKYIPKNQVRLMKKLTPDLGISFFSSYNHSHNFILGDFEIFEFKKSDIKVIFNTSFAGYAVNLNNELYEFDNYLIGNIASYIFTYNNPKLVKLNKKNVYELLQITNSGNELWFMGPTKFMLAYQYIEKNANCYLLVDNEIVVGTVTLFIDKEKQKYDITNVLVDSRYQKRGYGKALILESLKIFAKKGIKSLILFVEKNNERALKTYLNCGFKLKASYISNYELIYEF